MNNTCQQNVQMQTTTDVVSFDISWLGLSIDRCQVNIVIFFKAKDFWLNVNQVWVLIGYYSERRIITHKYVVTLNCLNIKFTASPFTKPIN